jgi:prephenate dehydrogenase
MDSLDGFTVAVAGLGLMGGSLAMALKRSGAAVSVLGADANPAILERAQTLGIVDGPVSDFTKIDLIVLAMPVRGIIAWLESCGSQLPAHCIVMDLGSTKRAVVAAMNRLTAQCVGGHPMCGKESAGLDSADGALFQQARFVLTPTERTTERALAAAKALVVAVGANLIVLDAKAHDRAVAAISHMPYLLSVALVNTVGGLGDENAARLAASGYRSMSRLAASDLLMWSDIIATNGPAIVDMLDRCQREIDALRESIASDDEAGLQRRMLTASNLKREP